MERIFSLNIGILNILILCNYHDSVKVPSLGAKRLVDESSQSLRSSLLQSVGAVSCKMMQ